MNKNDFKLNTTEQSSTFPSRKFQILLSLSTFLTGFLTWAGIWYILFGISDMLSPVFLSNILFYICMACLFISCITMKTQKKPFSKVFSSSIRFIGLLYIAASVVLPNLPNAETPGFVLFVFLDGTLFTIGLLFYLFGSLLKEAFQMQEEIDELL